MGTAGYDPFSRGVFPVGVLTILASHGYVVAALDHTEVVAAQVHTFTRGLALAHLDATLCGRDAAGRFLAGDVEGALAAHGVDAIAAPSRQQP